MMLSRDTPLPALDQQLQQGEDLWFDVHLVLAAHQPVACGLETAFCKPAC